MKTNDLTSGKPLLFENEHPIGQASILLCRYWIDRDAAKRDLKSFHEGFEAAKPLFPGIARIFAEVLLNVATDPTCYQTYLDETKDCYNISFIQIVPIKEPWEQSLE